jgi:hypothetical protein
MLSGGSGHRRVPTAVRQDVRSRIREPEHVAVELPCGTRIGHGQRDMVVPDQLDGPIGCDLGKITRH